MSLLHAALISLPVAGTVLFAGVSLAHARLRHKYNVLKAEHCSATTTISELRDVVAVREFQVDRLQGIVDAYAEPRTAFDAAATHGRALERVRELIDSVMPNRKSAPDEWEQISRPMQQVVIRLQGPWRSEAQAIFAQLDVVRARLENGHQVGYEHDEDFGYEFTFAPASQASSFFPTPVGRR